MKAQGPLTPICINAHLLSNGHGLKIEITCPDKSLHLAQYIDVIEGWLVATKKQFENELKEFQDLQKSGKLVSISEWKKKDGA